MYPVAYDADVAKVNSAYIEQVKLIPTSAITFQDLSYRVSTSSAFSCNEKVAKLGEIVSRQTDSMTVLAKASEKMTALNSREIRYPSGDIRRWFNYWGGLFK